MTIQPWPERRNEIDARPARGLLRVAVTAGHGGTTVVRVDGEVDVATAPVLSDAVATAVVDHGTERTDPLVLDLRGVTFIDCAGMAVLLEATERAHTAGRRLPLITGSAVLRVADLLRVRHLFDPPPEA